LDAQMPEMDGFMLMENLKMHPELPMATVMMLTSGGQRGDAKRCQELGISAYLTKPVRQWELREAMLKVLGAKQEGASPAHLVTRHSLRETRTRLHILLAEDNAINREVAVRLLTKRGHTVAVAENGKQAVSAFEEAIFDMILMDVQMPEMDGFEATAAIRLKEKSRGTRIPIIAMTAHAMKGDRERCLAAGMDEYIAKPIAMDELIKVTEGLVASPHKSIVANESAVATFDHAASLARVGGDENLLFDLANMFFAEAPKRLSAVRAALEDNDADRLRRAAHSMKGSVSAFAARRAGEAATRLEDLAQTGQLAGAEAAYEALVVQVDMLTRALQNFVRQDKRILHDAGVSGAN
jgi:two-component system, sensor histidine kinase and response regulator